MKGIWNALWSAFKTHLSLTLARPTFQIVIIVQPIVIATISYMLYKQAGQEENFLSFVVLGSGIAGMWSAITFSSAGDINRERSYGTLGSLLGTPTPLLIVMLGKIMANAILSVLSLVVSVIYANIILGISISILRPLDFLLALIVFLLSVNLFALVLSSIFLLSRSTTVLQNFMEYPILIVTGVLFTTESLPIWVQSLGWPIPLTWGAEALRLTVTGWNVSAFWRAMGIELGLISIYSVTAVFLFRIIENRVRVMATLDIY